MRFPKLARGLVRVALQDDTSLRRHPHHRGSKFIYPGPDAVEIVHYH